MARPSPILEALLGVARGAASSAAMVAMDSKAAQKDQMARRQGGPACTPCAAQAYVDSIRKGLAGG